MIQIVAALAVSPARTGTGMAADSEAPTTRLLAISGEFVDLAIEPEGRSVVVLARRPALDVARALLDNSRHISALLLLAVVFGLARALMGIARRPQISGAPYCRKCHYCLQGLLSTRCPECGWHIQPNKTIIGATRALRVRRALLRSLLLCAAPMLAIGLGPSRLAPLLSIATIRSTALWDALHPSPLRAWIESARTEVRQISRISVEAGHVISERALASDILPRALSQNGRYLLCETGNDLIAVDTASGSVHATKPLGELRIELADSLADLWTYCFDSTTESRVFLTFYLRSTHSLAVVRWDLKSRSTAVLFRAGMEDYPASDSCSFVSARQVSPIGSDDTNATAEWWTYTSTQDGLTRAMVKLRMGATEGDAVRVTTYPVAFSPSPSFCRGRWFICEDESGVVTAWPLWTEGRALEIDCGGFGNLIHCVANGNYIGGVTDTGAIIAARAHDDRIEYLDGQRCLDASDSPLGWECAISCDGTALAVPLIPDVSKPCESYIMVWRRCK